MNNYNQETLTLSQLFADASKEIVERSRIKAQMRKLNSIMDSDKKRLQTAYAELGKIYFDGTEKKNAARVEILKKLVAHLKERIERGDMRLAQLEIAHSVDDCTKALKAELSSKLSNAKASTTELAKDLGAKTKKKAIELKNSAPKLSKLSKEQDTTLLEAIKEELENDPETKGSAETTLSKIQDILSSLSDDTEESSKEAVDAIVEEVVKEASEKKDEVAEDFTF